MIQKLLRTRGYGFIVDGGTDHLERHQTDADNLLGKGVINFYNKQGGIIWVMFVGKLSETKRAIILSQIESECGLKFYKDKDVFFKPEYEHNLVSMFGDKLVIE